VRGGIKTFQIARRHEAHHQEAVGDAESSQVSGLLRTVHTQPVGAEGRQGRHRGQAVAVGVGLDHSQQIDLRAEQRPQLAQVVLERGRRDLDPLHRQ
jgi:hypothetical protein